MPLRTSHSGCYCRSVAGKTGRRVTGTDGADGTFPIERVANRLFVFIAASGMPHQGFILNAGGLARQYWGGFVRKLGAIVLTALLVCGQALLVFAKLTSVTLHGLSICFDSILCAGEPRPIGRCAIGLVVIAAPRECPYRRLGGMGHTSGEPLVVGLVP